jgi:hypothetical protein
MASVWTSARPLGGFQFTLRVSLRGLGFKSLEICYNAALGTEDAMNGLFAGLDICA